MKYYKADAGKFWDVFPAAIRAGRKYYEAFPIVGEDMWGSKVNWSRSTYYEKGLVKDLEKYDIREVSPSAFSLLK